MQSQQIVPKGPIKIPLPGYSPILLYTVSGIIASALITHMIEVNNWHDFIFYSLALVASATYLPLIVFIMLQSLFKIKDNNEFIDIEKEAPIAATSIIVSFMATELHYQIITIDYGKSGIIIVIFTLIVTPIIYIVEKFLFRLQATG